jgi:acetyl-CoA C-acetyltransferase
MTGGVGTSSQAPYYLFHPRYDFGPQSMCFHDQKVEIQTNAQPVDKYGELTIADLADIIASNNGLNRLQLDEYTAASKARAAAALKNGAFKDAIVPIVKKVKKADVTVDTDEGIKKAVSLEELMAMPAINCCGNSSQGNVAAMADGSASIVMVSADSAKELGATPLATVAGFGIAAGNPTLIERTTVKSIEKALKFAGISLSDVDYIDLHEQSAAYALAVSNLLGADAAAKINVDGGSLAFGHAGSATGGAMVVNMIYRLQRTGAKCGLITVGALGGQALSIIVKR